jgi:hypothetical protein
MRSPVAFRAVFGLLAVLAARAEAQNWPVGLTSTLQWTTPAVGPAHFGGVTFDASGSQMLVVGAGATVSATAFSYTPIRDPGTSRITGLSAGTSFAPTPGGDGGLELQGGLLWWTKYGSHQVGQYNPANATSYSVGLPAFWSTTGGLTFVPAGYPNAGMLLVSSYTFGWIYSFPLVSAGNGFFNLGPASLYANMPQAGSEGMKFITSGPLAGHLLVANYTFQRIDAIPINPATSLPMGGVNTPVVNTIITGLAGAEGLGVDPVTGDLFISSLLTSILYRVDGFGTFTALSADHPSVSVGGGAVVKLFVRAGTANAGRGFALAGSASGTMPGTPIGTVIVPLNVDAVTNFVIANWNTALFTFFLGTTDATGAAVATLNIPPILIGGAIGLDFAGGLLSPVDFATNAVHLTLTP